MLGLIRLGDGDDADDNDADDNDANNNHNGFVNPHKRAEAHLFSGITYQQQKGSRIKD